MTSLLVHSAGPGVSLQDSGRRGYLRFGVTHAGPMDAPSHVLANIAVGNDRDATAIEVSLGGLELSTTSAALDVAVVGPGFNVSRDGQPVPTPCRLTLKTGERLKVSAGNGGSWCYIAVAAGVDLPKVLGSQATHSRSGFGGIDGRCIAEGDRIALTGPRSFCISEGKLIAPWLERPNDTIRVLPGPQRDYFDAEQYGVFLQGPWQIGARSDRMGIFLEGPRLRHQGGYDIVSDGVVMGSIQVPGDGLPITLMADSQSTGGYPKIATIIGADLGALSQVRPGGKISFVSVSHDEALEARKRLEAHLFVTPEVEPFFRSKFTADFAAALDWSDETKKAFGRDLSEDERHERGELTAGERLSLLFDKGSYSGTEHGTIFVAQGQVYGQEVLAFANIRAGGLGAAEADILIALRRKAQSKQLPLIGLYDAALIRGVEKNTIQTLAAVAAQRAGATNLEMTLVFGQLVGAQALLAGLADVVLAAGPDAGLAFTGPEITERLTNEIVSFADLANADDVTSARYEDEVPAVFDARRLLSIFAKREGSRFSDPRDRTSPGLDHIRAWGTYDILEVVRAVADYGELFELRPSSGASIVTVLAKVDGISWGILASQPRVNAGLLSAADMEKAGEFLGLCERRQLPLLCIADTPGILHRTPGGCSRTISAYLKLALAQSLIGVPRVTVATGPVGGLAAIALGAERGGEAVGFCWAQASGEFGDTLSSGDGAFEVIAPRETRAKIIGALRSMTQAGK